MKILRILNEVCTAQGNVMRGAVEVNGSRFDVESGFTGDRQWVHIIDESASCETCTVDGQDIVADGGECVTREWTDADWEQLRNFVFA